MKSAKLEWALQETSKALRLLDEGVTAFPDFAKLWMMRGQILESLGRDSEAKDVYNQGVKRCTQAVPMWRLLARLEERTGLQIRARSVIEKARLRNPQTAELWLEAVRVESRAGLKDIASGLLARALQECPSSGLLWAEAVAMADRTRRKTTSVDALKKCEHDAHVLLAVSKLFWAERKLQKTRDWFNRTLKIDPDLGDAWICYYKFEQTHGEESQHTEVRRRCVAAEPRHGAEWCAVSKDIRNWRLKTEEILETAARQLVVPT